MFLAIKNKENRNEKHKTMINTSADVKCKERLRKPGNKAVSVFSGPSYKIRGASSCCVVVFRFQIVLRLRSRCEQFKKNSYNTFFSFSLGNTSLVNVFVTFYQLWEGNVSLTCA